MNTLNKLLDKAAEVCGSDLATAAKLRITRSAVSKWRHGGKITPAQLAKLLELTQQDPAIAVQVMQEQDADPAEHRLWSALWDRLSPATSLVVGALLLAGLAVPYPAKATVNEAPGFYIMRTPQALAWPCRRACDPATPHRSPPCPDAGTVAPSRPPITSHASSTTIASCTGRGPAGAWPGVTWSRPMATESRRSVYAGFSGGRLPRLAGTVRGLATRRAKRVTVDW